MVRSSSILLLALAALTMPVFSAPVPMTPAEKAALEAAGETAPKKSSIVSSFGSALATSTINGFVNKAETGESTFGTLKGATQAAVAQTTAGLFGGKDQQEVEDEVTDQLDPTYTQSLYDSPTGSLSGSRQNTPDSTLPPGGFGNGGPSGSPMNAANSAASTFDMSSQFGPGNPNLELESSEYGDTKTANSPANTGFEGGFSGTTGAPNPYGARKHWIWRECGTRSAHQPAQRPVR